VGHQRENRVLFLLLGIIALLGAGLRGQDLNQVQVGTVKVTENIYMLTGAGGNIGVLVGTDGILLIDSQFPQLADKIKAALAPLSQGPVRLLLNTNWHYDHVMGNEWLAMAGAIIIAQENTRTDMAKEQRFPELDSAFPAYPEAALPRVTFKDSLTVYFNGEEIEAIHVPAAHSDADLAFYFRKANVMHTGDLFFSAGYPFIDVSHGGSTDGMIAGADKLIGMTDAGTKFICGHGPLSNREGVRQFRDMLITVHDRIARLVKEGKTLEQVLASKPTADFDKPGQEGVPAEMFVKIVYGELAKRQP
jgi:glyoxylase-like metal-dependent hydrolase (beta-lactamase superfamily II)